MNRPTAVRLIAIDLDGTLHNSAGQPDPQGCQALVEAARRGIRVVFATARNTFYTVPLARQLGLSDPLICVNGAQVLAAPDGPMWANHTIPLEIARAIARMADEHCWDLSITAGAMTYWQARPGRPPGLLAPNRRVVSSHAAALQEGLPLRILAHKPAAVATLLAFCHTRAPDSLRPEIYLNPDGTIESLGIFPRLADKGSALRLVLERLAIDPAAVLAIGDNLSDLPMFAVAGLAVAMGNAVPEVQAQAQAVAPTNDLAGAAWAIQTYCFDEAS